MGYFTIVKPFTQFSSSGVTCNGLTYLWFLFYFMLDDLLLSFPLYIVIAGRLLLMNKQHPFFMWNRYTFWELISTIIRGKKRLNETIKFLVSIKSCCAVNWLIFQSFNCFFDVLFFFTLFHSSGLAMLRTGWDHIYVASCILSVGLCCNFL